MLDAANGHITVLSGGFPCQPVSGAGKRLGSNDERWMWNDYARIIRETQPDWIIIENSPRLFIIPEWGGVQSDLETAGYEIQAFRVPASGVGAPHIRERAVVVANTCRVSAAQTGKTADSIRESRNARRDAECRIESDSSSHAEGVRLQTLNSLTGGPDAEKPGNTGLCGDSRGELTWESCKLPDWKAYPSCICRMDDGFSRSVDKSRLQALGNAVVPRVLYPFFREIRAIEENE